MHRHGHKRICARFESRLSRGLALGVVAAFLTGCGTFGLQKQTTVEERNRLRALEKDLKRKRALIDELREKNLILERRVLSQRVPDQELPPQRVPVPFDPSAAFERSETPQSTGRSIPPPIASRVQTSAPLSARSQPQVRPAPVTPAPEPATVPGERGVITGEQRLYSKVLETYRARNLSELQKTLQILLKTYPESIYADNALYMAGLLAFETNDHARAAQYMERVIREYPKGNKTVSALFAKAMIARSNPAKAGEAKEILKKVRTLYPGSPEAARASVEERVLNISAGKRRES